MAWNTSRYGSYQKTIVFPIFRYFSKLLVGKHLNKHVPKRYDHSDSLTRQDPGKPEVKWYLNKHVQTNEKKKEYTAMARQWEKLIDSIGLLALYLD